MPTRTKRAPAAVLRYQRLASSRLFTGTLALTEGECRHSAFMPGCALASYSPSLVKAVYAHLRRHYPGMGLLMHCCANPVCSVGDTDAFSVYYARLEHTLEGNGLDTVITACANCYRTLKKFSPRLTVRSLYDVLLETDMPPRDYSAMPPAALHDPCPLRGERAVHDSVRQLLGRMRYPFEEFSRNREHTVCCGCKAMLPLTHPQAALARTRRRCAQSHPDTIVSYCQSCVQAFTRGGKKGIHILDLLLGCEVRPGFAQPRQGTPRRWWNRFQAARMARP